MEKNRTTIKVKKLGLKFRHIYALIMIAVTSFFAWHAFDLLVLTPARQTGRAPLGDRMAEIELLEDFWLRETEEFGATLADVDYVEVIWTGGPVVYVSVRVFADTPLSYARVAARDIVEYFVVASNNVAMQYDLQVVLSTGIIAERNELGVVIDGVLYENQAAVIRHVHEYNARFAERTLAHAELYPSQANFDRAEGNINRVLNESIVEVLGAAGLAELRNRLNAIVVSQLTPEDEDYVYLPWYQPSLQIEQSQIADFPNWGTWNNDRNQIIWRRR